MVQVQGFTSPIRDDRVVEDVAAQDLICPAADWRRWGNEISVRRAELELLITERSDRELVAVQSPMTRAAQQNQIVEIGLSAAPPESDVVSV
jgi:hypothetical protein